MCLRTTHIHRANTNQRVIEDASRIAYGSDSQERIRLFSDMLKYRRVKLAGHIIRTSESDPMRQISYKPDSADIYNVGKRRIGGPRQNWLYHTNKFIWEDRISRGMSEYDNTEHQTSRIHHYAVSRQI